MNKQVTKLLGITEEDYVKWCKTNKRAIYKRDSRKEFIDKVQSGKLERDENGNFVKCRKKDLDEN